MNKELDKLIEFLVGSCQTLDQALDTLAWRRELTEIEESELFDLIFLCNDCNWWYSTCEIGDKENCCYECSPAYFTCPECWSEWDNEDDAENCCDE